MTGSQPRIVAIIQARMNSSRLPGKVLLDLAGEPMLVRVVERVRRAHTPQQVVVATTLEASDDAIAALCAERNLPSLRGNILDVLDRYYQAACAFQAEVIVRVTADCPLIDPGLIDDTVLTLLGLSREQFRNGATPSFPFDFTANRLPPPWKRTFPIGLDVEVCSFAALERAWRVADQAYQREHVMPYLYDHPGRFRVRVIDNETDYGSLRWTVDTPADLELVREIYRRLQPKPDFSWLDVIELFRQDPELQRINAQIQHKSMRDVDDRLQS